MAAYIKSMDNASNPRRIKHIYAIDNFGVKSKVVTAYKDGSVRFYPEGTGCYVWAGESEDCTITPNSSVSEVLASYSSGTYFAPNANYVTDIAAYDSKIKGVANDLNGGCNFYIDKSTVGKWSIVVACEVYSTSTTFEFYSMLIEDMSPYAIKYPQSLRQTVVANAWTPVWFEYELSKDGVTAVDWRFQPCVWFVSAGNTVSRKIRQISVGIT